MVLFILKVPGSMILCWSLFQKTLSLMADSLMPTVPQPCEEPRILRFNYGTGTQTEITIYWRKPSPTVMGITTSHLCRIGIQMILTQYSGTGALIFTSFECWRTIITRSQIPTKTRTHGSVPHMTIFV